MFEGKWKIKNIVGLDVRNQKPFDHAKQSATDALIKTTKRATEIQQKQLVI